MYRERFNIPVVGLTGSVGKTTTKEMIYSVLSEKYNTLKTQGNLNNEIGLPTTLFSLDESTEAAVIEMGMNHFGEISRLTNTCKPTMAVITNIGVSHIEYLGSRDGILKAKCEIFEGLKKGSYAALNGDDDKLAQVKDVHGRAPVFYGRSPRCRVTVENEIPRGFDGTDITAASVTDRARMGIAFAFQQPVRFKGLQVVDLLRLAAGTRLSVSDACTFLASVGLCARDYIDREVNASLSGGELKRIEIATVLARNAALSVFDEPEAGIDLWSFQNLIDVFRNMREKIKDSSILIISHQERILNIADEIIVIRDGVVDRKGSLEEIYPGLAAGAAAVSECEGQIRAACP
jgi:Fe-S cluster assembly ATP-binding protein